MVHNTGEKEVYAHSAGASGDSERLNYDVAILALAIFSQFSGTKLTSVMKWLP